MKSKSGKSAISIALVLVGGLVLPEACAHRTASPSDVVRDFASAVQHGDYDHAYLLMSADYRRKVPLSQFRAEIDVERQSVALDAANLVQGLARGSPRPARSDVETPAGEHVALILQGGVWKLSEQPLAPFGQQSPRAALRTFVRAIGQRRYDVVLRLLPARHRSQVTEAKLRLYWEGPEARPHRQLLDLLHANLDAPIIELGGEAQMPYGRDGQEGEVRFLFEEGVWKIDDAG